MKKLLYTLLLTGTALTTQAQEVKWNTPGAGNPFLPGYFADPTVKKFGDTYYIYATTELARQPLDMGTRCHAAYRRHVPFVLLPALQPV